VTDIIGKFRSTNLLFKFGGTLALAPEGADPTPGHWSIADPHNIDLLFRSDRRRYRQFMGFSEAGCLGLFLSIDKEWVFYVWSGVPGNRLPAHLPPSILSMGGYWTFGSHTREAFRGRGYYKRGMRRLIHLIHEREPECVIYGDTTRENIAVRRALPVIGFTPCGIIIAYQLWVPRAGEWVMGGKWLRNTPHPINPSLEVSTRDWVSSSPGK